VQVRILRTFLPLFLLKSQRVLEWSRTIGDNVGVAYLLKKHIQKGVVTELDISFARQLLGVFLPNHPIREEFKSWASLNKWKSGLDAASQDLPDFEKWLTQFSSTPKRDVIFGSLTFVQAAADRIGYPAVSEEIQDKWQRFATILSAES
jgi:hypothetical protein